MRRPNDPTAALIELVISLEAARSGIQAVAILHSKSAEPTQARWRVWREVIRLSGCTVAGLARTWGIDRQAVWRAHKARASA